MTENAEQQPEKELNKFNKQQIMDNILANMPSTEAVEIDLPSRNLFYNLIDPAKPITLRPMTFEDERAMVATKNATSDLLNVVLTRCVSNINVQDLLQMDKLYLIMKVREISYGDEYQATINCTSCRKENLITFTLSEMPVTYVEEDLTNPMSIELPVLKKKIKIRLPRVSDEHYFSNAEFAVNNLWRFVEEIDGCDDKTVISKIVPQLPLKDAHIVLDHLSANKYGTNTKVRFVCAFCPHQEVMELPITSDFFTAA